MLMARMLRLLMYIFLAVALFSLFAYFVLADLAVDSFLARFGLSYLTEQDNRNRFGISFVVCYLVGAILWSVARSASRRAPGPD
jgi:hypothetical protein